MKLILLLASICTGLTGVSAEVGTTDNMVYNLWCDPAYEDECYFVEGSCNPETDSDFNCEYHPALFVEDDDDAKKEHYMLWCDPSDEDECYFVDQSCDPKNPETCDFHPAIFVDADFEEAEKDMMNDGGRRLSRYYRRRHHRYGRYRRRPYHRYRRRRRRYRRHHRRYYGGW
jgi:hypothetical protein